MSIIPEPASLRFSLLHDLHQAMVETHPSEVLFEDFKYWIQFYASKMSPMKFKESYDDEAWAKFLDKILSIQPALTLYENYWPVEVYFNFYTRNRRRHKMRKSRANSSHGTSPPSKSPKAHSVHPFGSRLGNKAPGLNRSMALSVTSQSPECHSTNAPASTSFNKALVSHGRPTPKSSHVVTGLVATSQMSVHVNHPKLEERLVVSCFKCGNTVAVEPIFKKRLVDLVGDIDILSNLANFGISHDQHLNDLHHLKHDGLVKLFSDVASNQITPLAKLQFIKSIQAKSFNIRKRGAFHSASISCPTLIQLPCGLHPPIDISKVPHTIQTRLHAMGIAGLIPALAYVGIHSEAHFTDFCKLNDQERDDLFTLGKLKLSQFQRFMLHLALSSGHSSLS